jgi:hypothetical protein
LRHPPLRGTRRGFEGRSAWREDRKAAEAGGRRWWIGLLDFFSFGPSLLNFFWMAQAELNPLNSYLFSILFYLSSNLDPSSTRLDPDHQIFDIKHLFWDQT